MLNSLMWKVSRRKTGLSDWLRGRAETYLDYYRDYGYDFRTNGEERVLRTLAPFPMLTVFDVGANVGDWSKVAFEIFGRPEIHAFELSESTRATLRLNLDAIGSNQSIKTRGLTFAGDAKLHAPAVALGAAPGEFSYKDYGDGSTVNTLVPTAFHDGTKSHTMRTAQVTTGDAYVREHGIKRIDLLKVDVEGAELSVLQGFKESIAAGVVNTIQFEYGYANGDAGHLMKDFYELLSPTHEIGRIWSAGVEFGPFEYRMNNFDSGPNFLAVRREHGPIIDALRGR
jgi:FkbM family methyltransferase